eukprot:6449646-Amphidinium_carterae.1
MAAPHMSRMAEPMTAMPMMAAPMTTAMAAYGGYGAYPQSGGGLFNMIGSNHDGRITRSELTVAFR